MKIAIVGTGISGLAAAQQLSSMHDIHLFEKADSVGGHSHAVDVDVRGIKIPVDTGFIVFNPHNYPRFTKLLKDLKVDVIQTDMSFGVSFKESSRKRFEYCSDWPFGVFACKKNIFNLKFWLFLKEIKRFNSVSRYLLHTNLDPTLTIQEYLDLHQFNPFFSQRYLVPMAAAIWSAPFQKILQFPAVSILRFFENHGLLTTHDHPQWYTIKNSSRSYVQKLIFPFHEKIRLNCRVTAVTRQHMGVNIHTEEGSDELFDAVLLACHADQANRLIKNGTDLEHEILSSFSYQKNSMYLHQDPSFMPRKKNAWASWNVSVDHIQSVTENPLCVTYWMNRLQNIPKDVPVFVTLNPPKMPDNILKSMIYSHPLYDQQTLAAQKKLCHIQGQDRLWFCGSYFGHGFHEDALTSGQETAQQLLGTAAL